MFTYPQDECFFAIAKTFLTSIIASSHLPRSHSAAARVRIKGGYSTIFGDSDAFKASSGLPTALKHEHKIAIAPKLPGAKCRISCKAFSSGILLLVPRILCSVKKLLNIGYFIVFLQ